MKLDIICETGIELEWRKLKNYQGELKDLSKENFEKFKKLIIEDGFAAPIFVWKGKNNILDGHQRIRVLEELFKDGYDDPVKLPCVNIRCRSAKHAKKLILYYASQYGNMTDEGFYQFIHESSLVDEIDEIMEKADLMDIDWDEFKAGYFEEEKQGLTDDDAIPEKVESRCKKEDLWKLGKHRLLCGDATSEDDVERLMEKEKADMVFTDPPYGVEYDGGHFHSGNVNIKRARKKIKSDETAIIYYEFLPVILPFITGACYIWFADSCGFDVYNALIKNNCEIHALIIWYKINATYAAMNAQYKKRHEACLYFKPRGKTLKWCGAADEATVWEIKKDFRNDLHPTQKPIELSEKAIKNHKANIIADFFGGSGSTLIACEKLKRRCFMMEIDPHYCDVIIQRWEEFTGQKAKLSQRHPAL